MRFHTHLLPIYVPGTDPPFGPYLNQVLDQVTLAEELGWECQWFTEHHFVQYGGPIPNPAVMLAAAAARTSRIRLGSAISILPLHHPVQTAEDYAMVDALSGGRLEFGIGRGNTALDYTVYGVDRAESHARLDEALAIIRKAWSQERLGISRASPHFPTVITTGRGCWLRGAISTATPTIAFTRSRTRCGTSTTPTSSARRSTSAASPSPTSSRPCACSPAK